MLNLFNQKELMTTFSMKEQSEITEELHNNGVKYRVKTVSRMGAERGKVGSYGLDEKGAYQYIIFVKKNQYEKAQFYLKNLLS